MRSFNISFEKQMSAAIHVVLRAVLLHKYECHTLLIAMF